MGYNEYLQKSIDFIDENVKQEVTIEECANAAGFSKYHYYRLFGLYVGISAMDYVRKRKLAYAMYDICQGKRILDVALDYNYSSERSFSRAFLQEFGDNPSKFRGVNYSIPKKPTLKEFINNVYGGKQMDSIFSDVRFENLDTMFVASAKVISANPEEEVVAFLNKWIKENGVDPKSRKFGFDIPVSEEERSKGLRGYEFWIKVDENTPAGKGAVIKKVEWCKYAVLRITEPFSNPFDTIPRGWKTLVNWVNDKGYKASCDKERYWLEEVLEIEGVTYMDIYFPIN
ncbi:MAG TPA: helix-turn-helix domain-containing protein [Clostridia bacterium]|nr:helix-turn-helix domain-containing protein [Clostridia bacterium]